MQKNPSQSPKASDSPLPSIQKVLSRPRHVLKSMSSRVQELASHLAELQTRSTHEVSEQKAQYEEKLRLQRDESAVTERQNAGIRKHVEHLREDNAKTRKQTVASVQVSRHHADVLKAIRENFTEAGVVLTDVFAEAHEKMNSSSPKLQVLQGLVEKDALLKKDFEQQRLFDEIENPVSLALLQVEPAEVKPHKEAQELVQSLMASLGSLTEEQNVSSVSLQADFDKEWEAGVKRQSSLLEEQVQLNATEVHEQELNTRLHVAFHQADEVRTDLRKHLDAIRHFAQKVGDRPMPESSTLEHNKLEHRVFAGLSTKKKVEHKKLEHKVKHKKL